MQVDCVLCHAKTDETMVNVFDTRFGINSTYAIVCCPLCGLEQTAPLPCQDELNRLYETYYNFGGEMNTGYTRLRTRFLDSFLYRIWLALDGDISFHLNKGSGKLLDVGCNEGRGLEFYQGHGFSAEGLELNGKAAAVARNKGFTVYDSTLEGFTAERRYDVIVLSNVLEHSLDPGVMIQHIHRLLTPNGVVWISCPNSQSWLRSMFGRYWINWHVPFHIVHFSPDTLKALLLKSHFEVVDMRQETPALWVAHSLIAGLFSRPGRPTRQLRSAPLVASLILLIRGLLFPLLWLGNLSNRGDCLVVSARKI